LHLMRTRDGLYIRAEEALIRRPDHGNCVQAILPTVTVRGM
jgi:hypothetical protein